MPQGNYWSDDQIKFLKEQADRYTTKELVNILGRSEKAIYRMNSKLRRLTRYSMYRNSKTILETTLTLLPEQLGYIAGIIDGEGTITFEQRKKRRSFGQPIIRIANTNYELIKNLNERLDFSSVKQTKPQKATWKVGYFLQVEGFRVVPLLNAILPYLIVKKKQAELVLRYIGLRMNDIVGSELTQEEKKIMDEIRELNKKGPRKVN